MKEAEIDFGFASFSDGTFELIAINLKTYKEVTLYGKLRPEQTLAEIDEVFPTCVFVRGAQRSLTEEIERLRQENLDLSRKVAELAAIAMGEEEGREYLENLSTG